MQIHMHILTFHTEPLLPYLVSGPVSLIDFSDLKKKDETPLHVSVAGDLSVV